MAVSSKKFSKSEMTAIYVRQSRSSNSSFSSCKNQSGICFDFAQSRNWLIVDFYSDEGVSSATLNRPELVRLLSDIEAGEIRRVVVYAVDRLTRRLLHLQQLLELFERKGVQLHVVTDPNYGESAATRLTSNIVAAASEFQLDLTRERMAESRLALKSKGKRVAGRLPFGYSADPRTKKLIPNPHQSRLVFEIFQLASAGGVPTYIAEVANLQKWEFHNNEVGKWTDGRVLSILTNPTYQGRIRHGASTLPGEHSAIVSCEVFNSVQDQLKARRTLDPKVRRPPRSRNPYGAKMLGLVVCGSCNRPMSTSVSQRGSTRYLYYRCRSKSQERPPCSGVNIQAYELEGFVLERQGHVEDTLSIIPLEFRVRWRALSAFEQSNKLREVVMQVIYDQSGNQIVINLRDDSLTILDAHE